MSLRELMRERAPRLVAIAKRMPSVERWLDGHPPPEPDVRQALALIVSPGDTVADVGAHHGTVTSRLARLVGPAGRVIAFEAHPSTAQALASKFSNYDTVTVEHVAVADRVGSAELYAGRENRSAEWNLSDRHSVGAAITVPTITLDAYFAQRRLDACKIDVEGAEGAVLEGMQAVLERDRPVLVIEFHGGSGARRAADILADHNYELLDVTTRHAVEDALPSYFHGLALP